MHSIDVFVADVSSRERLRGATAAARSFRRRATPGSVVLLAVAALSMAAPSAAAADLFESMRKRAEQARQTLEQAQQAADDARRAAEAAEAAAQASTAASTPTPSPPQAPAASGPVAAGPAASATAPASAPVSTLAPPPVPAPGAASAAATASVPPGAGAPAAPTANDGPPAQWPGPGSDRRSSTATPADAAAIAAAAAMVPDPLSLVATTPLSREQLQAAFLGGPPRYDYADFERDAVAAALAYLGVVDAGRHDEARTLLWAGPTATADKQRMYQLMLDERVARGQLTARRVAMVSGRDGTLQVRVHHEAAIPRRLGGNRTSSMHVEEVTVVRRPDGRLIVQTHTAGH